MQVFGGLGTPFTYTTREGAWLTSKRNWDDLRTLLCGRGNNKALESMTIGDKYVIGCYNYRYRWISEEPQPIRSGDEMRPWHQHHHVRKADSHPSSRVTSPKVKQRTYAGHDAHCARTQTVIEYPNIQGHRRFG